MKKTIHKRLTLLSRAREHSSRMLQGPAFVTDFAAMRLIDELVVEMQQMLAENLKLEEILKSRKIFKKG